MRAQAYSGLGHDKSNPIDQIELPPVGQPSTVAAHVGIQSARNEDVPHHPRSDRPLAELLGQRRWIKRCQPFPHVIAYEVFRLAVYERLERRFIDLLDETAGRPYMRRHDIYGRTVEPDIAHHFDPLLTRPWHDLLARVLGITATGHVAVGMHHHRIGSRHGFPHNDLNPGWFLGEPPSNNLLISGPEIDYTTGALLRATSAPPVKTIRAAAALFYLANPNWEPGDGGATGLYRSADDDVRRPAAAVPPLNNSMLLFECTPRSFHGFISNRTNPRNSIIMWLHRPKDDVIARWGEEAIIPYGRPSTRKGTT